MAATEPIRKKKQVKQMACYFLEKGQIRNYLLMTMGVHTALRISDMLALKLSDVFDYDAKRFNSHIHVTEKKTGKWKSIALNKDVLEALKLYFREIDYSDGKCALFRSNRNNGEAISRVQAYRIIREAADAVNIQGKISCHSLRKTFGYHAWQSGAPVTVIMDIYNHSSYEITRRYLGINQDDRDKLYLNMNF